MPILMALIAIFLCLSGGYGQAGPWLRAPGSQFFSLSLEAGQDAARPGAYGAAYYEYGLRPNLTLGIDAGRDSWGQSGTLVFLRIPLMKRDTGAHMATDLAFGGYSDLSGTYFALRPGLSWGRPLKVGQGGWLSFDATYAYIPETEWYLAKLEGTLGLNRGERAKLLLQITAEKPARKKALVTATPSLAWRVGQATHLLGGLILRSDGSAAAKLGLWFDF